MSEPVSNSQHPRTGILLSISTCGATGSVALCSVDSVVANIGVLGKAEFSGRTHSARLIPQIGELLNEQQLTIRDLQAIVVVCGPGSFTGIRVGLSTAKGLAEAANLPIIAVSQLALVAFIARMPHVIALLDAGRGEYYAGEYREGIMLQELLLSREQLVAAATQPHAGVLVCPNDVGLLAAGFPSPPVYVEPPDAVDAVSYARERFLGRKFDDVEILDANYLRRSGADLFGAADPGSGNHLGVPSSRS